MLYERALGLLTDAVDPDHPTLLAVRSNLSRLESG